MFGQLFTWQLVGSIVRRAADAVGGYMVGMPMFDPSVTGISGEQIAGAIFIAASLAWSAFNKAKLLKAPAVS